MGSCMDMAETAAVTVKGAKLRNIIELPFGNQVIKIKQEFYSEKNLMHKICKEPIPRLFWPLILYMSMKDSCITRDTIGRHT